MATTLSLNSADNIMITTFYGGNGEGRCYTIHMFIGPLEFKATLTEAEFIEMVVGYAETGVTHYHGSKPECENRHLDVKKPIGMITKLEKNELGLGLKGKLNENGEELFRENHPVAPIKAVDPELEALLDEEERIARLTHPVNYTTGFLDQASTERR